jgi:alkylhydroperoxidase family enzyme
VVAKVGDDWRTAPVRPEVRAALGFIEKLVKVGTVNADDVREVYAAGVPREALVRAVQVCVCFSMIVRLADTFEFRLETTEIYDKQGMGLWKRGYGM